MAALVLLSLFPLVAVIGLAVVVAIGRAKRAEATDNHTAAGLARRQNPRTRGDA